VTAPQSQQQQDNGIGVPFEVVIDKYRRLVGDLQERLLVTEAAYEQTQAMNGELRNLCAQYEEKLAGFEAQVPQRPKREGYDPDHRMYAQSPESDGDETKAGEGSPA